MTKETAIDILESQKNEHYKEEINEALDMAISALSTDGEYIKKEEALLAVDDALKKCFACFDKYDTWWLYKGTKLSVTKAIDSISAVRIEDKRAKRESLLKKLRRWFKGGE